MAAAFASAAAPSCLYAISSSKATLAARDSAAKETEATLRERIDALEAELAEERRARARAEAQRDAALEVGRDARRVAGQAGGSWYDLTAEDQRLEEEAAARVAGLEAERDAAVEAARRNAEELVEPLRAAQVAALDDLDDRTARDQQVARAADILAEFQGQVVGMAEKHRAQLAAYDA